MTRPHMFDLSVLTALADGSLPAGRRRRIEERLASGPALRAEVERQRFAVAALRSVEGSASASLRSRVDSLARGPVLAPTPGRGADGRCRDIPHTACRERLGSSPHERSGDQ